MLGSKTGKDRFSDASKLLDYGFANYAMYLPKKPDGVEVDIPVKNGMTSSVKTECNIDKPFLIKKGGDSDITSEIILVDELTAPVKKGTEIGKVVYKKDNKKAAEYPITAAENISEIKLWDIFSMLWQSLAGC